MTARRLAGVTFAAATLLVSACTRTASTSESKGALTQPNATEAGGPATEADLPVAKANLEPTCAAAGSKVKLSVDTGKPNIGVVYLAHYADDTSGAPPPWGNGYGGNAAGHTDDSGAYADIWVLRADTPPGAARVDITIVYSADNTSEVSLPFMVTRVGGQCL